MPAKPHRKITISPPISEGEEPKWRWKISRLVSWLNSPEAWINMTLQNSWVALGGDHAPPRYFKDDIGMVHLGGGMKDGTFTDDTVVANLPAGYRPEFDEHIYCEDHTPPAKVFYLDITPSGDITIHNASSNGHIALYQMSFRAYA